MWRNSVTKWCPLLVLMKMMCLWFPVERIPINMKVYGASVGMFFPKELVSSQEVIPGTVVQEVKTWKLRSWIDFRKRCRQRELSENFRQRWPDHSHFLPSIHPSAQDSMWNIMEALKHSIHVLSFMSRFFMSRFWNLMAWKGRRRI